MIKNILANFTLEQIVWVFAKKCIYIVLFTVIVALAAGFYAYNSRHYTYVAETSFYVYSNPNHVNDPSVNINSTDFSQAKNLVNSYMQIIRSRNFLEKVIEKTGLPYTVEQLQPAISARAVENTAVFVVSVFGTNPHSIMEVANAVGALAPGEITRIVKAGGIEVVDPAALPVVPYASTSVLKYVLVGALGSFLLATAWFMLRGLSDTTIRKRKDVERLFNLPILGEVPRMLAPGGKKEGASQQRILSGAAPFAVQDAYSGLGMNLLLTGKGESCPVFAITSAMPGEGKSLNSVNLAIMYSRMGKKVLLVDADMRNSSIPQVLDIPGEPGLSQYLAGLVDEPPITAYEDIWVLPAGQMAPNPGELLVGGRCAKLFAQCRQQYDIIFVDLPPLGAVSDALALYDQVTTYLLVVCENQARFDLVEKGVLRLEQMGAEISGIIYNKASLKGRSYYSGYEKVLQPQ